MPPAFRPQSVVRLGSGIIAGVAVVLGSFCARQWHQAVPTAMPVPETLNQPVPADVALTGSVWDVMQGRSGTQGSPASGTPDRFRMLGVFAIEGAGTPVRKAVVDDMLRHEQHIVGAGDRIDDSTVERVDLDRVFLMTPRGLVELKLEFAAASLSASPASTNGPAVGTAGTTNRFGCVQTEENRWQFNRKPMLDYYQELLDEPERMVTVFDTMKPVRDDRNKITGYVVGIEGEADFFHAVGLRQGDIVRKVNSLPMTNRRRAESMIDQFLKEQMNVVVLDVERDGKPHKQIYQLAP